jgi:hypothetical protein
MEMIFGHFSDHRRDFCHLVTIRLDIFARQRIPTVAAHVRFDVVALLHLLNRYQFPSCAFVSWLCPALAPALSTPA